MILSVVDTTIRMVSIEVLLYWKDGEVEAGRMSRAKYHGEIAALRRPTAVGSCSASAAE
jgi:hypothetical protein